MAIKSGTGGGGGGEQSIGGIMVEVKLDLATLKGEVSKVQSMIKDMGRKMEQSIAASTKKITQSMQGMSKSSTSASKSVNRDANSMNNSFSKLKMSVLGLSMSFLGIGMGLAQVEQKLKSIAQWSMQFGKEFGKESKEINNAVRNMQERGVVKTRQEGLDLLKKEMDLLQNEPNKIKRDILTTVLGLKYQFDSGSVMTAYESNPNILQGADKQQKLWESVNALSGRVFIILQPIAEKVIEVLNKLMDSKKFAGWIEWLKGVLDGWKAMDGEKLFGWLEKIVVGGLLAQAATMMGSFVLALMELVSFFRLGAVTKGVGAVAKGLSGNRKFTGPITSGYLGEVATGKIGPYGLMRQNSKVIPGMKEFLASMAKLDPELPYVAYNVGSVQLMNDEIKEMQRNKARRRALSGMGGKKILGKKMPFGLSGITGISGGGLIDAFKSLPSLLMAGINKIPFATLITGPMAQLGGKIATAFTMAIGSAMTVVAFAGLAIVIVDALGNAIKSAFTGKGNWYQETFNAMTGGIMISIFEWIIKIGDDFIVMCKKIVNWIAQAATLNLWQGPFDTTPAPENTVNKVLIEQQKADIGFKGIKPPIAVDNNNMERIRMIQQYGQQGNRSL